MSVANEQPRRGLRKAKLYTRIAVRFESIFKPRNLCVFRMRKIR